MDVKQGHENENQKIDKESEPADIGKVFKGLAAIGFFLLMLMLVIKKISSIKEVNTSGWFVLSVFF